MKYLLVVVILLWVSVSLFGQSLSPERVTKIKSSTVRIIVEGGISIGTGFFIDELGTIVTCGHVVIPALKNNKRTFVEFNNGDTAEVGTPDILKNDSLYWQNVGAYDFFILMPVRPFKSKVSFLKLGNFDNAKEGEEIYSCGYPLGLTLQFLSKGIISGKYTKSNTLSFANKKLKVERNEALLDMTLNKGNSGGAIVKVGKTVDEDEIIGIADFIINPMGNRIDSILKTATPMPGTTRFNWVDSTGKTTPALDVNSLLLLVTEASGNASIGVSGCVSINHFIDYLEKLKEYIHKLKK